MPPHDRRADRPGLQTADQHGVMKVAKQERNPQRGGSGVSQPITRHPLFPAIVALWFGALFGMASVLMGPGPIERAVAATGLAKAIPMAGPPLGSTARLLVALGLTGIGALFGALIGLRLAARRASGAETMRDMTGDALEDSEEPSVGRLPSRRRGFTAPFDNPADAPSEAGPQLDPAPAPASGIFQLSDLEDDEYDARFLPMSGATVEPQTESEIEDEPKPHLIDAFSPAAWADPAHSTAPAPDTDDEEEDREAPVAPLFDAYAGRIDGRSDGAGESQEQAVTASASVPVADAPSASPGAERIAAARLDDLSHVELLERLALAMEEQRRKLAQATPRSVVPFAARQPGEAHREAGAPEDPALSASADPTPVDEQPPARPQAPSVSPVLQRLSSLGVHAPFTPPPFAPPPFGERQPTSAEAGDEPVQPVADLTAPDEIDPIGGWPDEAPAAEVLPDGENPAEPAPRASAAVPAALRPVATSAFDEDDAVPGYIPPRHIAMPASAPATQDDGDRPMAGLAGGHDFAADEGEDEDEAQFAGNAESEDYADDGADIVEEGVLDEGYSSLLSLQRRAEPRQSPIGIENEVAAFDDPAAADDPIHSHTLSAGEEQEAAFAQPPLPGARLFDPPGRSDPVETEKALRAALATLQRMSGAA